MQTTNQIRIKDIARQCNVSAGTVDRVLHNRSEVAPDTRDRILRVIEESGFQPNILASTLALNRPFLFASLLPTPPSSDGYWNRPNIGIQRRTDELQHYRLQIEPFYFNQNSASDFEMQSRKLLDVKPDGVILAPYFYKESLQLVTHLRENHIPFVFIDSDISGQGQLAYVGQNSYQCGYLSARLLSSVVPMPGVLLVVHFAKEMDNQNHLMQREKGFYDWFRTFEPGRMVRTYEISFSEENACAEYVKSIILSHKASGIFVTNSKVDLLKENVNFLRKGNVSFLICQRPEEQGYNALDTLFRHVVQKVPVVHHNYTAIDIIIRENVDYYKEFK
jgi:LacI family transcriptional regulator